MGKAPKVMIVAGEASGEMHAASLMSAFKQRRPDAQLYGVGGPALRAEGVFLIRDVSELSSFGIFEVANQLPQIGSVFFEALGSISREKPDVVVLVDYPDFNIRLARAIKWLYGARPLILYYIAPQVWIWRRRRAKTLARLVDRLAVVLPFEKELFENLGAKVHFVGHPLLDIDENENSIPNTTLTTNEPGRKIALLPGSRRGELKNYMPPMMEAVNLLKKSHQDWEFFIIKAPTLDESDFTPYLDAVLSDMKIVGGSTRKLLKSADFAVIALGTATLEAALAETPALLVGKASLMSYALGIYLFGMDYDYYSLVNFILERPAFPELIQGACIGRNMAETIEAITSSERSMAALKKAAVEVRERLEVEPGVETEGNTASRRTAAILDEMITESINE